MARSVAKATHDSGSAVQPNQPREVAAEHKAGRYQRRDGRASISQANRREVRDRQSGRSIKRGSILNPQHIFFMSVERLDSTPIQTPELGAAI
jgi:hypothetical protein